LGVRNLFFLGVDPPKYFSAFVNQGTMDQGFSNPYCHRGAYLEAWGREEKVVLVPEEGQVHSTSRSST